MKGFRISISVSNSHELITVKKPKLGCTETANDIIGLQSQRVTSNFRVNTSSFHLAKQQFIMSEIYFSQVTE